MSAQSGLYAYGLVNRKPEQLDMLGIDKKNKVQAVAGQDVWVIVSTVDIDQFQTQVKDVIEEINDSTGDTQREAVEILQAHEQVIEALMHDATVVPFKFGTILKDEKAVLQMLQTQEKKFKGLLTRFTGKVEWGLKIYADRQALIRHIENEKQNQEIRQKTLSRGAAYLLEKKREETRKNQVVAQLAQAAEEIFQALAAHASEARLNKTLPQKMTGREKDMILNAAYLVEKEKTASFLQQGRSFVETYAFMGLDMAFSGPWPPYNFI